MAEIIQKRMAELLYYKIWNQRDLRLIPYVFSDNCITQHIGTDVAPVGKTVEYVEDFIKSWLLGFPRLSISINKMATDQTTIFVWCTCKGIHNGRWAGIDATGKPVVIEMMAIHTIKNGKITENKILIDHLAIHRQLGTLKTVLPAVTSS